MINQKHTCEHIHVKGNSGLEIWKVINAPIDIFFIYFQS